MKKLLTLALGFILAALSLSAQITLTSADIHPLGFTATQATDTILDASILIGGTGAQTWDFSALENDGTSAYQFMAPSVTPYAALFPEANLAATVDDVIFLYLKQDGDRLAALGSFGEFHYDIYTLNIAIGFQPDQSVIRFPAQLGNAWEEDSKQIIEVPGSLLGVPFDSIRLLTTLHRTVTIDAFGDLISPTDTFATIRSTELETAFDSTFVKTNGVWQLVDTSSVDTTIYYNWWTNESGLGFPVVQIVGNPSEGTVEANWLMDYVSGSSEVQRLRLSLSPNPASGLLTIELPEPLEGSIELYDFNGKRALVQPVQGLSAQIVIEDLIPGAYVAVLKDGKGRMLGFEKFEVMR